MIAGRLAKADPSLQILLIEAGPTNRDNELVTTPAYNGALLNPANKAVELYVSKFSDHVGGRNSVLPQARILGGGSSINLMMYTRASASDYDAWNTEGWSFDDLKPLFEKVFMF